MNSSVLWVAVYWPACRIVLAGVYLFIATFIIVDLVLVSQTAYNLVSVIGIVVYLVLLFVCSRDPAKVSTFMRICMKYALY